MYCISPPSMILRGAVEVGMKYTYMKGREFYNSQFQFIRTYTVNMYVGGTHGEQIEYNLHNLTPTTYVCKYICILIYSTNLNTFVD